MRHGKAKVVVSLLLLAGGLASKAAEAPKVEQQHPQRLDRYGDPLPSGAIARLGTIRWRHGDQVRAVAFSPDGKTLASGAQDKLVHLWDAKTGQRLRSFRGHDSEVNNVFFSPDGKRLITHGWDKTIRLWSVATGKELRCWETASGWEVALSPDGRTLAGFGRDQPPYTLCFWDVTTGAKIREMPYEGKSVCFAQLAFSPDGKTLLSSYEDELRRWDVATGKQLEAFGAGRGLIRAVAFAPDGKIFAVGSEGGATLWDAGTRKIIRELPESPSHSVAFSADGKRLAAANTGGDVRIWDVAAGKEICTCKSRRSGGNWSVAFAPDGKTVAVSSPFWSIQLWDTASGEERTPTAGHESWLRLARLTPDGKSVLTGSQDGWVRRWDIATSKETLHFRANSDCMGFALAPDGRTVVAYSDGVIELRNTADGRLLRRFAEQEALACDLVFSPRGDRIASVPSGAGGDWRLYLWDVKSGKKLHAIRTSTHCPAFSPDGKILATGGGLHDRDLCLWDADTGKSVRHWAAHGPSLERSVLGVNAVAFSPDGNLLASAGADRTIRIWDAATGRSFGRLQMDRPFYCRCLTFAPDGKTLATAGADQTVRLWETASGKERRCFRGHSGWINSVSYSADGGLLVSGGGYSAALVWAVWPPVLASGTAALTSQEKDGLWIDLAVEDASRAWRAMIALHNNPRSALMLLKGKLPAAVRPDAQRIARLLADLDNDQFDVRSQAERELEKLEELAEPALRRALRQKPHSLEQRLRLQMLHQRLEGPITSTQTLRQLRAVELLEHLGTPEARKALRTLTEGTPEARLTREAKAALERLAHRMEQSRDR